MSRRAEFEALLRRPKVKSWSSFFVAHRAIFSYLDSELSKKNCSIAKYQILHNLYFFGPQVPVALARALTVSRANIATFVKRLLRDELIQPTTNYIEGGSPKRPAYRLTYQGEKFFEDIFEDHIRHIEEVVPEFDSKYIFQLENISEHLDKK